MASKFAEKLVDDLQITDRLTAKISRTTIDIALLKVVQVLAHAQHRNHDHAPDSCSGCEELEKVVGDLKIQCWLNS